jgi:hypothetical protein
MPGAVLVCVSARRMCKAPDRPADATARDCGEKMFLLELRV